MSRVYDPGKLPTQLTLLEMTQNTLKSHQCQCFQYTALKYLTFTQNEIKWHEDESLLQQIVLVRIPSVCYMGKGCGRTVIKVIRLQALKFIVTDNLEFSKSEA